LEDVVKMIMENGDDKKENKKFEKREKILIE
jgi:hypothetical protein